MWSIFLIEKTVIVRARTSRLNAHYSIAEDRRLTVTVTLIFDLTAHEGRIEAVATLTQTISLGFLGIES